MEHLYFTMPFAFEGFVTTTFGQRTVSWLAAIPVSTAEVEYARQNSTEMLKDAFEQKDIDWFDLNRASIF